METLKTRELNDIKGGAKLLWYLIGAAAILLIGIIDGLFNPQKCNN